MIVLTALLTSVPDPQRGYKWECDPLLVEELARSLDRHGFELIVLHDEDPITEPKVGRWQKVERQHLNVYFARWFAYRDALGAVTDAQCRIAWCVDGTDVELLNPAAAEPGPDGELFVGSELQVVGNQWLHQLHPSVRPFIEANPRKQLLNAGLVGAELDTLRWFCEQMAERANTTDSTDMGVFNEFAWSHIDRIRTGPPIHTVFKADDRDNTVCWWRHK